MHIPDFVRVLLLLWAQRQMRRPPDFIVGHREDPYLHRWRMFPKNGIGNIYVHKFWKDDEDRALHDHPYPNLSIVLKNGYYEQLNHSWEPPLMQFRDEGWVGGRRAATPHRVVVRKGALPISLFLHGPRVREWGFHCPKGWVHWQRFHGQNNPADQNDSGGHQSGSGCE